jgi:hypothetical protein
MDSYCLFIQLHFVIQVDGYSVDLDRVERARAPEKHSTETPPTPAARNAQGSPDHSGAPLSRGQNHSNFAP